MAYERQIRPMLTVREVAEMLHIHTNTVRRWSDQGVLRAYRITHRGDRRFRREDVAHFLAELNYGKSTPETTARTLG
jgi:excisionase family DNA binding protein